MEKTYFYGSEEFDRIYSKVQEEFQSGLTDRPRFAEPQYDKLFSDIVSHMHVVSKTLYRKMCLDDEAIELGDMFSTIQLDWYTRESNEWFTNKRTGKKFKKKKYDPSRPLSFRNWLFTQGKAAVQSFLFENGYKRPVVVDEDGIKHRAEPRRLNVVNFSSFTEEIGEEGAGISVDNIADPRFMDAEPERAVVTDSIMNDVIKVIDGLENLDVGHKEMLKFHFFEGKSIRYCKELFKLKEPESKLRSLIASSRLKIRKRLSAMGYDRTVLSQT